MWWIQVSGLVPGKKEDCMAGLKLLRSLLFLFVTLQLPSTLTRYLSWSWFSRTLPVLSHLLARFPAARCFWMNTCCPGYKSRRGLVWYAHFSPRKVWAIRIWSQLEPNLWSQNSSARLSEFLEWSFSSTRLEFCWSLNLKMFIIKYRKRFDFSHNSKGRLQ